MARYYKKKAIARKSKQSKAIVLVNKALSPIPQRFITKMKYAQTYTAVNASGQAVWRINLNSINDPDRTGTGHQPYSHDTFATLYNRYRVIACSYVINAYSAIGAPLQIACLPANEEFAAASISDYRENPRGKYAIQLNNMTTKTLRGKVYLPSLVGRNKSQYMADDRYQAQMLNNPAELSVLNICAQSMLEGSVIDPQVTFAVTLVYHVELFDVKNLGQS